MIEVTDLTKKYGSCVAVDHLSFQVEQGQNYGFLGPNGAGKSTTMNILTGYLGATSGKVMVNGYDMSREAGKAKRCIGYLPEFPPLYQDMTVREYLGFAAELKGIKKSERRGQIQKVVEMTGIGQAENRLIRNLSKGFRQRTGLAQALLGFPEILILDEPTSGLDPKQIIEIRDLIKSLGKKHTVILSSHILSEVSAVCDHILIISHGRLAASDTPENLSRLMQRDTVLEVTVKGGKEKVQEAFSQMEDVTSCEIQDKAAQECLVSIRYGGEKDIRETIFQKLSENKLPILSMQTKTMSLEDVFLELTEDDGDPEKGGSVERNETEPEEDAVREKEADKTDGAEKSDEEDQTC